MKRLLIVIFSAMLLLNMFGCAQKSGDPVNNEVFTDEFFQDVVEFYFITDDPVVDEQLASVVRYLKSLHLTHSEEDLVPEGKNGRYGGWTIAYMYFIKLDGTRLTIRVSQWAMSGLPGGSYCISDYKEAIERGEKSLLRSIWEACGKDPDAYPFFN